ncbi:MAG: phytanoyl-CoA dioxygenase family protein [Armatimonadetes bacterium]|nr:phytanoyl-CoA dioxygenase family protein [Armatimonadota bacterium]
MATLSGNQYREPYEADGFYIASEPVLPAEAVRKACEGMDAIRMGHYDTGRPPCPSIWNPGDDPARLCKIEQPQFASRAIRELLVHPALGELAAAVTGGEMVQVWWVQLLYKPPGDTQAPTNIGWHQDRYYWTVWEEGSELFTAWIALSDVRPDCGPMRFVRGSHRWGFHRGGDFYAQDLSGQKETLGIPAGSAWEEVSAILPPGGVSFHHNLTFHGSGPNESGFPRRSLAVHMRTRNSRPVHNERVGLVQYIDDPELCPVIYGRL